MTNLELMKCIQLYQIDGKYVFPIMTPNRLPTGQSIMYLICQIGAPANCCYVYGIEFTSDANAKIAADTLARDMLRALTIFLSQLESRTARSFNTEGGDLGRGDNV